MSCLCDTDLLSVCLGELYFVVVHSPRCVKPQEILLDIFSQLMTYCSSSLEVLQQFFFPHDRKTELSETLELARAYTC